MQLFYPKEESNTAIVYGEVLSTSISSEMFIGKHIIILTNQRYYDRFFEKIQRIFSSQSMDWYVCSNLVYGNHLQEFMDVLNFLGNFSPIEEYLFIAFGNEGVVQLAGFLQKTTVLKGEFWVLPVSLRAYASALLEERFICRNATDVLLKEKNLPKRIFLDHTIVAGQAQGKLVDLLVFIRAGVVCDYPFLQSLFQNFSTPKQLQNASFTAFVAHLTDLYETSAKEIESFGKIFEEAFYLTDNGHILSENMKRFLGIVLHLCWNLEIMDASFNMKNFLIWLKHLGYPVIFPEQLSVAEYLQHVINLQEKYGDLVVLSKVGTIGERQEMNEQQLLQTIETYQQLIAKI